MRSGIVLSSEEVRKIIAKHFNVHEDDVIKANTAILCLMENAVKSSRRKKMDDILYKLIGQAITGVLGALAAYLGTMYRIKKSPRQTPWAKWSKT